MSSHYISLLFPFFRSWSLFPGLFNSLIYFVCSLQPCGHLLGKADLFVLLYEKFICGFVTFPYGFLGQVRVSIADLRLLPYFHKKALRSI